MTTQSILAIKMGLPLNRYSTSSASTHAGVDLTGYVNSGGRQIKCFANLANVAGTTPSVTIKVQDSADDSTYADITGAAFSAATTNGDVGELHFVTTKKYIRAVATFTANTTQADVAVMFLLEKRRV